MWKRAVFAVAVAAAFVPRGAHAETYYPWCAYYDEWTYSCSFTNRQQCLATISGVGGLCKPNPYPGPFGDERRSRRWRSNGY